MALFPNILHEKIKYHLCLEMNASSKCAVIKVPFIHNTWKITLEIQIFIRVYKNYQSSTAFSKIAVS